MALTDNLVSYWKLDESSGDAADATADAPVSNPSPNTLVPQNSATYGSTNPKINNYADLENSASENQHFSITDAAQTGLDISSDFSFAAWVKLESIPADNSTILSKWTNTGNQRQYFFAVDSNQDPHRLNVKFAADGAGSNQSSFYIVPTAILGQTTFSTGVWYHVVCAVDISVPSAVLYINGQTAATTDQATAATTVVGGTGPFTLGNLATSFSLLDGHIDEVGIWSRILTSPEVTSLYNSGNGLQYPFTAAVNSSFFNFMY